MALRALTPILVCACLLTGCATGVDPRDPYEGFNRKVYALNEGVDKAVLKPVARGYEKAVPKLARTGVTNFFNNLGVVVTALNDMLQLKGGAAAQDVARFTTNVVWGFGGLMDTATELGIANNNEDFGQTLGRWGVGSGAYLVLPLLGPSTLRDGAALPVDFVASPMSEWTNDVRTRNQLLALHIVNDRANLLAAERFLNESGLDRYAFLRDTYLQRREYLVHDGKQPSGSIGPKQKSLRELEEEDFGDEPVLSPAKKR